MIPDNAAQYQRLLAKAHDQGILIRAFTATAAGYAWYIESSTHEGLYVVRLALGGRVLECSCPAGVRGIPCKHACLAAEQLCEIEEDEAQQSSAREAAYEQETFDW